MYEAIKDLIGKLTKMVDWAEHVTCENKNEEFAIDLFQTRLDEMKEECIWLLKIFEK